MDKRLFPGLFEKAVAAGMAAGTGAKVAPMIVGSPSTVFGNDIDYSKKTYYVPDGPCGFAWVTIRPGNSKFANWIKKNGHGGPAYGGGVSVRVHEFGQSVARKAAYAGAFARVLRDAGINAYSDSRMD